ncbi:ABC-three component system middle component 2 [Streptomyces sp. NPDC055134]
MNPLNSPLEVGVRALVLLAESYPKPLDVAHLVLLDHAMLHSGELEGPPSMHPALPAQAGELGMRRGLLEDALVVLMRAGLAEVSAAEEGLLYHATDQGPGFVDILEAPYVTGLRERAEWALHHYAPTGTDVPAVMNGITRSWASDVQSDRGGDRD